MKPIQVNEIRILGKVWTLRRFDSSLGDACGITTHEKLQIDIDASQPKVLVQDTLLHELIHAIAEDLNLGLSEPQVATTASVLLGVMKDNPAIRKFIFG